MESGAFGRPKTSKQPFANHELTSLIYRDELPPEFRLPTLIVGDTPNLRGLNAIDNEQLIPDLDFVEALYKFGVQPSELEKLKQDQIRKTFSENEMSNYDSIFGRKIVSKSTGLTNLITNWDTYYAKTIANENKRVKQLYKAKLTDGISDEYIADFSSFNLAKFGVDSAEIESPSIDFKDESRKRRNRSVSISAENSDVSLMMKADSREATTRPIKIDFNSKTTGVDETSNAFFEVSAESFKVAASPERETDRLVLSSIPKNFQSLSFSYRKQMLTDLLPESLRNDIEYKNHITKILRKNSTSTSSLGSMASMFGPNKQRKKTIKPDTNEMGSVLMSTWKLGRIFNNGSFGIIRECFNIDNLDDVKAVKIIPLHQKIKILRKFQSEVFMWSKLNHETIVPLLDVQITPDSVFLLMPLLGEGSLFDRVKYWEANKIAIEKRFDHVKDYVKHISAGIGFLHQHGIHHGDIKLENFLLQNNIPKVCDFGMTNYDLDSYNNIDTSTDLTYKIKQQIDDVKTKLSSKSMKSEITRTLSSDVVGSMSHSIPGNTNTLKPVKFSIGADDKPDQTDEHDNNIGSLPYAAPELLQACPITVDRVADMWAFGVTVFVLVTLKLPFWHVFEPRLKLIILEGNWENEDWLKLLEEYPQLDNIGNVIKSCLTERTKRHTIDQIKDMIKG